MIVKGDPKTFIYDFVQPKDVDENLKHEIEVIIKSNESFQLRIPKFRSTTETTGMIHSLLGTALPG